MPEATKSGPGRFHPASLRDCEDTKIITRYAHQVEFEIEGQRKVTIDVRRVRGAALSSERCGGRLVSALVLLMETASGASIGEQRIEGGATVLAAVHQTVIEAMADLIQAAGGDEDASGRTPGEDAQRRPLH